VSSSSDDHAMSRRNMSALATLRSIVAGVFAGVLRRRALPAVISWSDGIARDRVRDRDDL
jgi:hypothetical protein